MNAPTFRVEPKPKGVYWRRSVHTRPTTYTISRDVEDEIVYLRWQMQQFDKLSRYNPRVPPMLADRVNAGHRFFSDEELREAIVTDTNPVAQSTSYTRNGFRSQGTIRCLLCKNAATSTTVSQSIHHKVWPGRFVSSQRSSGTSGAVHINQRPENRAVTRNLQSGDCARDD